jgi:heat-inducible transcriptional repressor
MILNDRKLKILEAIINDYIATAEPIGSRTIAKKYDIGLSSATIRNEMSDLEEMGFIVQPHASAGRVPSDKGYRLYVDSLMNYRDLTNEESFFLHNIISNNINQIDYLMQETAKAIALMTKYTTIVSEPQTKKTKLKHLQLVPLDSNSIIMVLVTDSKVVKNYLLKTSNAPSYEALNNMSIILNHSLSGCTLDEMDIESIQKALLQTGVDTDVIFPILDEIINTIKTENDIHVYTSGVKNILAYPEFSDLEKAKAVFQALEEKDILITLLGKDNSDHVKVVIGNENNIVQMKDCSIIRANCKLGDQIYGSIGIIGPTRMNYSQVVSILHGIEKNINLVLKALCGG